MNGPTTTLPIEVITKNFVADLIRLTFNFIHKNDKFALWATLWEVGGMYALHLQFVGKRVVHFLFTTIGHFFASFYGSDHLLYGANCLLSDLFWLHYGDCYSADDCLRRVFGQWHATVYAVYEQFKADCSL